jgi:hypothetical protein
MASSFRPSFRSRLEWRGRMRGLFRPNPRAKYPRAPRPAGEVAERLNAPHSKFVSGRLAPY